METLPPTQTHFELRSLLAQHCPGRRPAGCLLAYHSLCFSASLFVRAAQQSAEIGADDKRTTRRNSFRAKFSALTQCCRRRRRRTASACARVNRMSGERAKVPNPIRRIGAAAFPTECETRVSRRLCVSWTRRQTRAHGSRHFILPPLSFD